MDSPCKFYKWGILHSFLPVVKAEMKGFCEKCALWALWSLFFCFIQLFCFALGLRGDESSFWGFWEGCRRRMKWVWEVKRGEKSQEIGVICKKNVLILLPKTWLMEVVKCEDSRPGRFAGICCRCKFAIGRMALTACLWSAWPRRRYIDSPLTTWSTNTQVSINFFSLPLYVMRVAPLILASTK